MIQKELIGDLKLKWDHMQQAMQKINAGGCLLTVDVNLYYTTGRIYSGYFYLPAEGAPRFFVSNTSANRNKWLSFSHPTDWKCRKSSCSKPTS